MALKYTVPNIPDFDQIRAQVLTGIALNRTPGFHFPGYFLGVEWGKIETANVCMTISDGPHCRNSDGSVNINALAILADMALATTARPGLPTGARLATIRMEMRFTGQPVHGKPRVKARLLGFSTGTALRQSLAEAVLTVNGNIVAYASGEYVALDPPPAVILEALPWERDDRPKAEPANLHSLQPRERAILRACDAALVASSSHSSFIERFWGGLPMRTPNGARNNIAIRPHLGNRIGDVQGGILFGLAVNNACAAAPPSMMLSSATALYISPGRGSSLSVRSSVIHSGGKTAAVRTEIKARGGKLVLEVMTHHVMRNGLQ